MNPDSLSTGEKIAGGGAAALFIVLFLPWYGVSASFGGFSASKNATAWKAFSYIDIILLLVALVVMALVAAKAAGALPELPQPPAVILLSAGALAVVLILFRIIKTPVGDLPDGVDVSRKIGIFLGLICAGAITYGGYAGTQGDTGASAPPPSPDTAP